MSLETIKKSVDDGMRKMNLFGSKEGGENLPVSSGSGKGNGVSFSHLNFAVLLSVTWLLASLGLFGLGVWHCRNRTSFYSLTCNVQDCELIQNDALPIKFFRKDLKSAVGVRIDNDARVVDASQYRAGRGSQHLGHSVELTVFYSEALESKYKAEKKLLFAGEDMGSGPAKQISSKIHKFIYKPHDEFDATYSFSVTKIGLTAIIFGVLSTILSVLFGQWSDSPKRLKKAA